MSGGTRGPAGPGGSGAQRPAIVETFVAAIGQPGTLIQTRVREDIGGVWHEVELGWLNQLANGDVRGVIGTRLLLGPVAAREAGRGDAGESRSTNWVLLELDRAGTVTSARGQVESTFGLTPDEMAGRPLATLVAPDAIGESIADWTRFQSDPTATRVNRRRFRRADGTEVWLESSYLHERSDRVVCVLIDITDRMADERIRSELTEQLSLLADTVPTALVRCDAYGRVLFHNARWTELVDPGGQGRLQDIVAGPERERLDAALGSVAGLPAGERRVVELLSESGLMWEITLQAIGSVGPDRSIVASVDDATDTVQLRRAARHDGLTGLLNRTATEEQLRAALADDPEGTLVVFLDLDGFKEVNDTYGHEAGDAVLRAVAGRLRGAVRPGDDVGRYGGDEFVIVGRGIAPGHVADLMHRIDGVLADPVSVAGGHWLPAASVGYARAEPGDDLPAVVRRADRAMFDAKRDRTARGT